ncbi:hypothetical protein [Pedobacter gandavensis]|uniref:Uncharacterized protein n=1 Tax=Pedobacter gandavensis TaxID=2679963 RepID=A0ABR6EVK0_9SPHI|nr:hypothetical protein [Pedobacter gandavensis]MBB2148483.1 hypothetical protein [Pedobacter gandavensis]
MKKVFFGLVVVATALGASAFTSATKVTGINYQLQADGLYHKTVDRTDPDLCNSVPDSKPCVISLTNDQGLTFSATLFPLATNPAIYSSMSQGVITP